MDEDVQSIDLSREERSVLRQSLRIYQGEYEGTDRYAGDQATVEVLREKLSDAESER